jgi:hypothetical protein
MGLSYFVMLRPKTPEFSGVLRYGKALASCEPLLAEVAQQLQARPLGAFFSTDPGLAALELEQAVREGGVSPDVLQHSPRAEDWFSPDEGLATARALLAHVEAHPDSHPAGARAALGELVNLLEEAERRGLQWHLELF